MILNKGVLLNLKTSFSTQKRLIKSIRLHCGRRLTLTFSFGTFWTPELTVVQRFQAIPDGRRLLKVTSKSQPTEESWAERTLKAILIFGSERREREMREFIGD